MEYPPNPFNLFESAEEALGRGRNFEQLLQRLQDEAGFFRQPKPNWRSIAELRFAELKDDIEFEFDLLRIEIERILSEPQ